MALSKQCKDADYNLIKQKINKLDYISNIEKWIHDEEIEMFCKIIVQKPLSVKTIHSFLGGAKMDYNCIEVADSFECYQF